MRSLSDALSVLDKTWPAIADDCLAVLGSELHYQAMIYHCLRSVGAVPIDQIGMNVKMYIEKPVSAKFQQLGQRKHADYRGGFEPIPDVALFGPENAGDWRRRSRAHTLKTCVMAIEVKASERANSRLRPGEIRDDIEKLAAHREEALFRDADFAPVMLVIDSARDTAERMTSSGVEASLECARQCKVGFLYASPKLRLAHLEFASS